MKDLGDFIFQEIVDWEIVTHVPEANDSLKTCIKKFYNAKPYKKIIQSFINKKGNNYSVLNVFKAIRIKGIFDENIFGYSLEIDYIIKDVKKNLLIAINESENIGYVLDIDNICNEIQALIR